MRPSRIAKLLSNNDTGETGGHQAGILIPKEGSILSFFPELDPSEKNPRTNLYFDDDTNKTWEFHFIYYNNKFFGGTRNEYRLTGMTAYIHQNNLKAGDTIFLTREQAGFLRISFERQKNRLSSDGKIKLSLSGTWKVVDY